MRECVGQTGGVRRNHRKTLPPVVLALPGWLRVILRPVESHDHTRERMCA